MHQRSRHGLGRAWISGAIGLLLVSGCLPAPTRVTATALSREGTVKTNLPRGASGPANGPAALGDTPQGMPSPLVAPTIISNNGANILKGAVRVPASIISHNGGNIVSNNGGSIVSNNGGSIISHNGGNIISNGGAGLRISQVPLAFTTVRLKDAAGNPVKDDHGQDLVTKTDANGNYSFPVDVQGRNLVVEADVEGQSGKLKSLLPKDGLQAGSGLDVDLTSTLTLAYILDQYVKGDLATFERLPKDIEAKARTVTETAIVEKQIELPSSLEAGAIVAKVDEVRKADQSVDQVFEEIRKLLVLAGITKEGDSLKATDVDPGIIGGLIKDRMGNFFVFSQSRHTLWRISEDGILHTVVASGLWTFPEQQTGWLTPGYTSGMAINQDGRLLIADTYNNRIVMVSQDGKVKVVAGTGEAGFSGDNGSATAAKISRPSGLAIRSDGAIVFADTDNNRIRLIDLEGNISTLVGDGSVGSSGDGGPALKAQLNRPQGLIASDNGLLIADYGNNCVRRIDANGVISSVGAMNSPIAGMQNGKDIVWLGHYFEGLYQQTQTGLVKSSADSFLASDGNKLDVHFPRSIFLDDKGIYLQGNSQGLFRLNNDSSFSRLMGLNTGMGGSQVQIVSGGSITVDSQGNAFISDSSTRQIYKVDTVGSLNVYAGNGVGSFVLSADNALTQSIGLVSAVTVAQGGGVLFAAIGKNPVIQSVSKDARLDTVAGKGGYDYVNPPLGNALEVNLADPDDVIQMNDGVIVFSESEFDRIMKITADGKIEYLIGPGRIKAPHYLALDEKGRLIFVERTGKRISRLAQDTLETVLDESKISKYFDIFSIRGLAVDAQGNLFISSASQVLRYSATGQIVVVAGKDGRFLNGTTKDDSLSAVSDISLAPSGDLYILESTQVKRIRKEQLLGF